jgi:hypothetical protein
VISRAANPILAEREKTFQMEEIIRWMRSSEFKECRLVLTDSAENPAISTNNVNRTCRPPTAQGYLDEYLDSLRMHQPNNTADQLLVCFGGKKVDNQVPVFSVAGRYNGEATVWKQSH